MLNQRRANAGSASTLLDQPWPSVNMMMRLMGFSNLCHYVGDATNLNLDDGVF